MSEQFTPGPWKLFTTYALPEVRDGNHDLIAVVEDFAEARLICAAPELLAALRGLVYPGGNTAGLDASEPRAVAARAAIARATGEQA